jgi:hypothetical protein
MPHIATDHAQHLGRSIGTGHCVPFVREMTGLPVASEWRRGERVRGSTAVRGTAIATFDDDGSYGNHLDGRSHAAILLAVNHDGLLVADQWTGQPIHQRVIRYRAGQGDPANDGDAFFVIETA